jgi:glycosyltransferase involved in cell wall biosynthesis
MSMLSPLASEAPAWAAYAPNEPLPAPLIGDPQLPLVSIVTPSYRQGAFIAETVASVLGQDYPNLEYWVIDGGSDDTTLAVLERFRSDPRLQVISERDRGQSDAINKGWARCRGQILAWLNSDDTYVPAAISSQVAAMLAAPNAGAVYGDACYLSADGRPLQRLRSSPFSPAAVLSLRIPIQPTVFLRRAVVAQTGPLSLSRRYSMDSDYWARAITLAPWVQRRALVATYRLHAASKTVAEFRGFYADWLAIAATYYARPALSPAERAERPRVLADIYAALANLEARDGHVADAARYGAYALSLAGPRPRMLKLPLALLDRLLPLSLAPRATALWGRLRRP